MTGPGGAEARICLITGRPGVGKTTAVRKVAASLSGRLIRGFGSFKIRQRRARTGRNPKTGASVSVPGKKVPFFKVGKGLRELVNA